MADVPTDMLGFYERGLQRFLERVGPGDDVYSELLGYSLRMREWIEQTRRFGDTDERRSGRAEVLAQLNRLGLQRLGISFNELCGLSKALPAAVPHAFFCYSRRDSTAVELLAGQVRARGIRVWRDLDNLELGQRTPETILQAIRQSVAAIWYVTPASLDSDFITRVELPALIDRARADADFLFIPLLDGVTWRQMDLAGRSAGVQLSDYNAVLLPAEDDTRTTVLAQTAARIARSVLMQVLRKHDRSQPLPIELLSFDPAGAGEAVPILFDWRPFFTPLAAEQTWDTLLVPALKTLREVVGEVRIARLHVHQHVRLPAAWALGTQFPAHAGFQLLIDQTTQGVTTPWHTDLQALDSEPLEVTPLDLGSGSDAIALELAITRPLGLPADQLCAQLGITRRILLQPAGGPANTAVQSTAHALGLARQIQRLIERIRAANPDITIHILAALPFALAVMIARQLNRCGPLQIYDFERSYQPACRLE